MSRIALDAQYLCDHLQGVSVFAMHLEDRHRGTSRWRVGIVVGVVRDALIAWRVKRGGADPGGFYWSPPVVAETWDGWLNDTNGFHVKPEDVFHALDSAHGGAIEVRSGSVQVINVTIRNSDAIGGNGGTGGDPRIAQAMQRVSELERAIQEERAVRAEEPLGEEQPHVLKLLLKRVGDGQRLDVPDAPQRDRALAVLRRLGGVGRRKRPGGARDRREGRRW